MPSLQFATAHQYNWLANGIEVPVTLIAGTRIVEIPAKLDRGAAHCIFERRHAEMLSLEVDAGRAVRFRTATGSFTAYEHEINLQSLGVEMLTQVYVDADAEFRGNFLGRTGWLDRVRLGIVDYEQLLYLSPYGE